MNATELKVTAAKLVPVAGLRPAAWNANVVPPRVLAKIRRSIEEFGFVENLVARPHPDGEGFEVLSGNHRLGLLEELGVKRAPVVVVDLGDADARILAQALNRTRGADDPRAYARLLEDVLGQVGVDRAVEFLPETEGSIDRLLARYRTPLAEDELPAVPARPRSKAGEVYQLGAHRLACGDATDPDVLEELLAGQKVECVVTDPPYGVDYKGTANPSTVRAPKDIAGDGLASLVLEELLVGALALACDRAIAGAPIYVWFSHSQEPTFRAAFSTAGWRYAQTLIWAKNHMVLGRADYQWRHEPVLYGWKPGATHRWFGDHSETTLLDDDVDIRDLSKSQLIRLVGQMRTRENGDVLTAAKPSASELHPTQKPVWLLEHFMWNSTERDNVVLDPFAGSGSTLIAAEQTRRKAAIVEIDPAYCDVIRDRFDRLDRG